MVIICSIVLMLALAYLSGSVLYTLIGIVIIVGIIMVDPALLLWITLVLAALVLLYLFYFMIIKSHETKNNGYKQVEKVSNSEIQTEDESNEKSEINLVNATQNDRTSLSNKKEIEIKNELLDNQKKENISVMQSENDLLNENTQEYLKEKFQHLMQLINNEEINNDKENSSILYNIGICYEKIYKDHFRAACFIYLATVHDKSNLVYEKEYIRLCNLLTKEKGDTWTYYVTLVNDISDIDKYLYELIHQEDNNKKHNNISKNSVSKKVYVQPVSNTNRNISISHSYNESKFENFNTESYLHSLGYKVGKTGLSKSQRKKLLKKAINTGKISKYDVIETLERNISMFHNRANRQKAVKDWEDDLYFVKYEL